MSQPIILFMRTMSDEHLESLAKMAKDYRLVSAKDAASIDLDAVEIIVSWENKLGNQILASPTSQLKWVQVYSAGVDDLPLNVFKEKNILLSNASGVHSVPITESVVGMLLSHYRGLHTATIQQQAVNWDSRLPLSELNGRSLLIVGTGAIGRQLAKVATVLGVKVYGINRSGHPLENFIDTYPQAQIDQLLPKMDIVVNILPLTADTHYFYDAQRFQKMKDGVIFINVGRGPSVETAALIEACQTKIGFAGMDVFEEEPLPEDNPLWQMDNVLITPHVSGKTDQYNQRFFEILSDNLARYLEGGQLSRNQVQLDQGY